MSTDLPDFLSDEPSSASETVAAPETPAAAPAEAAQPAPASDGPVRAADGKFAPAPSAAAPAAPATPAPESHHVPLPTFLDMRDKLTAAEKEAKELREWRKQQEEQARARPAPDPRVDPEAYRQHQQAEYEFGQFALRRDMSQRFAELQHGKDTVDKAYEWAAAQIDADIAARRPSALNEQIKQHPDPVNFVVEQWKRDQIASNVQSDDYQAFLAWKASQTPAQPGQPAPGAAPANPTPPRASLAAAPSAGSVAAAVPRDGAAQFDAMFKS